MKQRTQCPKNLNLIRLGAICAFGAVVFPAPGQEISPDASGRPRIEIEPKSLNLGAVFSGASMTTSRSPRKDVERLGRSR